MLEIKTIKTTEEIQMIQSIAIEIWNLHFPGIISQAQIDFMLKEMYEPKGIQDEIKKGIIWKIFLENTKPIGYMSYSLLNQKCKLYKIYVHPNSQKKGYGKRGLDEVKKFAITNNVKEIILNVNRDNIHSLNMYLKYGYKIEKEENNKMGDFFLNDYLMKYEIV